MPPKIRARLILAVLGVLLLVLALYKAPQIGWWGVWLAVALLLLTQLLVGIESKRPPQATKRRQVLNTAIAVGGYLLAMVLSALWRGDEVPWSLSPLILYIALAIGFVSWFVNQPDEPGQEDTAERTR